MNKKSHLLTVILALTTMFFILTLSLAVPICNKWFYHAEMKALKIEEATGYSEETIMTAYGEMLDYCNGVREEFSVGSLKFSEEGASHFEDVRKLFLLDYRVLLATAAIGILWLILRKFVHVRPAYWKGHSPVFYGAVFMLVSFVVIGGLAALDFDKFFVIFHAVLFPGKTNWLFDPRIDQVINILPETFFMHCGIVIVLVILVLCSLIILVDSIAKKKREK